MSNSRQTYGQKLNNRPEWEKIRAAVLKRDLYTCQCCGSGSRPQVHHISYAILGIEELALEWLITVCRNCHEAIHTDKTHPLNPKNKNKVNIKVYVQRRKY